MPEKTTGRLGLIRPTEAQIRTNTIVVPKAFINHHLQAIRWFQAFDVAIGDERIANRKLDKENRVGGLRLRAHFAYGDLLQLEVVDGATLRISKTDRVTPDSAGSPRTRPANATSP